MVRLGIGTLSLSQRDLVYIQTANRLRYHLFAIEYKVILDLYELFSTRGIILVYDWLFVLDFSFEQFQLKVTDPVLENLQGLLFKLFLLHLVSCGGLSILTVLSRSYLFDISWLL